MGWKYKFPSLQDVPDRLTKDGYYGAGGSNEYRLGLFCANESHSERVPWLIGSLALSGAISEDRGESWWFLEPTYPTGDNHLIRSLSVEQMQLIADGAPQETPLTEEAQQGYGRTLFACHICGLRRVFKITTFQRATAMLVAGGIREISLSTFIQAVERSKAA